MADRKSELVAELRRWERSRHRARFWLRDDDAMSVTDELQRLAAVGRNYEVGIGLSLVPGKLEQNLVDFLANGETGFVPMCHGWVHANYGSGIAPDEFGSIRPLDAVLADARAARAVFAKWFPNHPAVFVPPYGNLAPSVETQLRELGFDAVSNSPSLRVQRLTRLHSKIGLLPHNPLPVLSADVRCRETDLHAHVDIIDWRRQTAHDLEKVYEDVLGELRLRRKRYVSPATPIGILTHHLVHDEAIWSVLDELLAFLRASGACTFPDLADLVRAATRGGAQAPAAA